MDAARFDKTRRIIELTEGLPDVACQLVSAGPCGGAQTGTDGEKDEGGDEK